MFCSFLWSVRHFFFFLYVLCSIDTKGWKGGIEIREK